LGCRLRVDRRHAVIAEVEAYHGEDDRACHAHRGRTARTEILYRRPGTLYVYLCYGIHDLLNLVCAPEGVPAAVLIRGVVVEGVDPRRSNGPGKVTRVLAMDRRRYHGTHLDDGGVGLLPGRGTVGAIANGPRVGVDYAGAEWAGKPWRWWLTGFPALRATRRGG